MSIGAAAVASVPNLIAALAVVLLTWLIALIAARAVRRVVGRKRRESLRVALASLARIAVWVAGLLVAATLLFPNLTPTKMLAGLGLGTIAIGLAFKDTFENFLAGILILLREPMKIGDDIECEGTSGRVEEITVRDSYIRMRSGELVLVPNSFLFKNPLTVLTDRSERRISLTVGVAYGEDVETARDVIQTAVTDCALRVQDRPVEVVADGFGASSIDFLVRWWVASPPPDALRSRGEVVTAIKAALDREGIEIPFPYRTLTFKEPLRLLGATDERS
jgi:small-conductance mechanosensitive channel